MFFAFITKPFQRSAQQPQQQTREQDLHPLEKEIVRGCVSTVMMDWLALVRPDIPMRF